MRQQVTIKDVAKRAGVSIATVSYVMNGNRTASPKVVEKVMRAVEEAGYYPDLNARSLKSRRTLTIGLLVPDNSNPFFAEIAKGVEDEGFTAGFSVILCNSNAMIDRERAYIDLLMSKRVDGVIIAPTSASIEQVKVFVEHGIPVAVFYRESGGLDIDSFRIDNSEAGYRATQYLIALGHRHIACIRPISTTTASARRVDGYKRAMEEAGLQLPEALMPQGDNRITGGEDAVRALAQSDASYTAIFSTNDAMAIGALRALRDLGLRIPEDVSVIGFDDIVLARYSEPPLTTIRQPKHEAGVLAVQRLVERIEKKYTGGPRDFVLPTELVERSSTKALAPMGV